jgi:hypothetical protein
MVYPGTLFHRRQRGIPMKIGVKSEHCKGAGQAAARTQAPPAGRVRAAGW